MNQIKSAALLRTRLREVLAGTATPLTSVELYDKPAIREVATSRNQVSVTLSDMKRAGELTRSPAVLLSHPAVKFAYKLNPSVEPKVPREPKSKPAPQMANGTSTKPTVTVTATSVTVESPNLRIVIEVPNA